MPPVPVYRAAPLHPQGVTPRTASVDESFSVQPPSPTRTTPANVPATTTAAASKYSPPPPQPGARPPPPTFTHPFAQSTASPYSPQPGAHPAYSPPKVIATHTTTETYLGGPVSPPRAMSLSAPGANMAPTHSTQPLYHPSSPLSPGFPPQHSPYEPGSRANSVYSRHGSVSDAAAAAPQHHRHSLEHPPGYIQNPYAAEGTAEDRARWAEITRRESVDRGMLGNLRAAVGGVGAGLKKVEEGAWKWAGSRSERGSLE